MSLKILKELKRTFFKRMNLSDLEVKMILPKLHLLSDLIIAKKYDFKTVSDKFSKLINDLNSNIIIENMTDKK